MVMSLAGVVASGRVDGAGLDGDIVVAGVGVEVIDADFGRREGIDGVGVGRVLRREHADVVNDDVVGVVGHHLPHGRILDGDSFDADVLAVVEDDEARARMDPHDAGVSDGARLLPPAFAVAVDGAFAGDGDVFSIGRADQRLDAWQAKFGDRGIVGVVGRAEKRGALIELESDVALEHDGALR